MNPLDPAAGTGGEPPAPRWHFDHVFLSAGGNNTLTSLFEGVMGLRPGSRPPFPFPGQWLYQDEHAMVHTVPDAALSATKGEVRLGHIAFRSDERPAAVIARLRRQGLHFQIAQVPQSGITQIFVPLPGGLVIELDLPPDDAVTPTHHYGGPSAAEQKMLGSTD